MLFPISLIETVFYASSTSGSHRLIEIVFYVALIVVICLAISFSLLFGLYGFYKRKHIKYGHEDEKIIGELTKKYRRQLSSSGDISGSDKDDDEPKTLTACIKNDENKSVNKKIASGIFAGFFYLLVAVMGVYIITFKVSGDNFFIGNNTYFVIQTGSMEEPYEGNTYIKENNLTDQITQYSMIGIEKVEAKDIELYDVVAFKNSSGDVIVHRVIKITMVDDTYVFTMRGDANTGSNIWETAVQDYQIIGRYNGFQNYGLGIAITYFKSSAGIVALLSTLTFLIVFEISEDKIDKEYSSRSLVLAEEYDNKKE